MFKRFFLIIILACFTSWTCWPEIQKPAFITQGQTQTQASDVNDVARLKVLDNFKEIGIDAAQIEAIALVVSALATIVHESGHAAAASLLFELYRPIQIHIGKSSLLDFSQEWFSVGNMHFYKRLWTCGVTEINKKHPVEHFHLYNGILDAAGGISAAVVLYNLLTMMMGYCAYCDNKNLHEIVTKSFINACSPFSYILETKNISFMQKRLLINAVLVIGLSFIFNIFYGLTPYLGIGDGISLWRDHMGVTGTPLVIVRVLSRMGVVGCWAWLIKKYYDARCVLAEQAEQTEQVNTLDPSFKKV